MGDSVLNTLQTIDEGSVTDAELAERLSCSRDVVSTHVDVLREAGFDLAETTDGYELREVPEYGKLALEYGLDVPFSIEYHDVLESTNDRARQLALEGESNVVVVAEEQTRGRGRLDREWVSPRGGVWLSILVRPDIPPEKAPLLTLAAAVAAARAARNAGVDAVLKWPNDVLSATDGGDRKLAGILTRMEGEGDQVSWIVVGIGVNANVDAETLPDGATSFRQQVGDVNRRAFVHDLLSAFADLFDDVDAILPAWRECAVTLGQRVRVATPDRMIVGEAVDVVQPGTLIVDTGDEEIHVTAGDCEHLRTA